MLYSLLLRTMHTFMIHSTLNITRSNICDIIRAVNITLL